MTETLTVRRRRTLTATIADALPNADEIFRDAVAAAQLGHKPTDALEILAATRERYGFVRAVKPLLTPPLANHKLASATVPSYGLTLFHASADLAGGERLNLCPWSTKACRAVCVVANGNGRFASTQRGWMWRTDMFATHPTEAFTILAWELVTAERKHGRILFRPNINSDVSWHELVPSLFDGVTLPGVTSYGYSKDPATLAGDGWLGAAYRVAYSWNERSKRDDVRAFLMRGGAVAVVTSRAKGAPVLSVFPFGTTAGAVDADVSDEWILTPGMVVGDLSAKGKARSLIGHSRFVVD
jgi:hypothetical protein